MIAAGHPTTKHTAARYWGKTERFVSNKTIKCWGKKALSVKGCVLSPSSVTSGVWIYELLMRLFTAVVLSAQMVQNWLCRSEVLDLALLDLSGLYRFLHVFGAMQVGPQ